MNTNLRRQYNKYRGFTFPAMLITFSIFLFFIVIIPVARKTISIYSEAKVIAEEVDVLKKRLAVLQQVDEATLERQLITATSAIPIDKSLPTILRTIEGVSGQTQVTITNLSMDQPGSISTGSASVMSEDEKQFGIRLLPFSVSLSGTFSQLKTFLVLSTQVRRFIKAKEFSVNFTGAGTDSDQITTEVLFDAFYSPLRSDERPDQLTPLIPEEEKTLGTLVGYPYMGESTVSQDSSQAQPLTIRSDPFSK